MKFFRKAVIGFSAIGATLLTLGTVTYAWFPINSIARVEATELSVHGGLGFMVSVDGVNYKNELTKDDIYNAMIAKYMPDRYQVYGDETHSGLYNTKLVQATDEDGNLLTVTDSYGITTPLMVYVPDLDNPATTTEKKNALKGIELMPLTSSDGVTLKDLYNSDASATTGRFIEFSVYFKTTSNSGEYVKATTYESDRHYYELILSNGNEEYIDVSDAVNSTNYKNYYVFRGFKYDIYLNGETLYSDENAEISPTKFLSVPTNVYLSAEMTAVINENGVKVKTTINKGEDIDVYSSNAIRMSITDENAYNSNPGEYVANVYELDDALNGNKNLGSYATTYDAAHVDSYVDSFKASKLAEDPDFDFNAYRDSLTELYGEDYCKYLGLIYSDDLALKYYYQNNAMYTYYSNLKQDFSSLKSRLKDYNDFPITIKDLISIDANGDYIYNKKITTLSSSEDGKLITFRIWLEGWDADCFDGLKDSITASLSFSSKRIY